MKDDFYFWCFVTWFASILLWGWVLTFSNKYIRNWVGGILIIFEFIVGIMLIPIFSKLSATLSNMNDGIKSGYDFILSILNLGLVFAPMFFMAFLLRKSDKIWSKRQNYHEDASNADRKN